MGFSNIFKSWKHLEVFIWTIKLPNCIGPIIFLPFIDQNRFRYQPRKNKQFSEDQVDFTKHHAKTLLEGLTTKPNPFLRLISLIRPYPLKNFSTSLSRAWGLRRPMKTRHPLIFLGGGLWIMQRQNRKIVTWFVNYNEELSGTGKCNMKSTNIITFIWFFILYIYIYPNKASYFVMIWF